MTIKDEICPTIKVDARLLEDGTLWIKTDKISDIGRVIVEDGKTGCKQFYQDAQPEPCEDAVSRQAAIDSVTEYGRSNLWMSVNEAVRRIERLPTVTPEPKIGKWIHVSEEMWKCDQCGEISCCSPNFCPDCGAKNV